MYGGKHMRIHGAGHDLLEAGLDGAVVAALACVAETTDRHGRTKYSRRASAYLARIVAARTYEPHVLQLCHLVNALTSRGDENYIRHLLGPDTLTADRIRIYFSDPASDRDGAYSTCLAGATGAHDRLS